jgi:hypothetical protein
MPAKGIGGKRPARKKSKMVAWNKRDSGLLKRSREQRKKAELRLAAENAEADTESEEGSGCEMVKGKHMWMRKSDAPSGGDGKAAAASPAKDAALEPPTDTGGASAARKRKPKVASGGDGKAAAASPPKDAALESPIKTRGASASPPTKTGGASAALRPSPPTDTGGASAAQRPSPPAHRPVRTRCCDTDQCWVGNDESVLVPDQLSYQTGLKFCSWCTTARLAGWQACEKFEDQRRAGGRG